jgi:hypothetical protein
VTDPYEVQGQQVQWEPTDELGCLELYRWAHSAMRGTGVCFEIAESAGGGPAAPSHISARMGRDVRIRYSTIGVVPPANSADPSSGRLWR